LREEDFARVIAEWRAWRPPASVERELKLSLSPTYIVAVAGPRQAGKTYRMFQLVRELEEAGIPRGNILYVNFEHERLRGLDARDLEDMMKVYYGALGPDGRFPIYLLLDEVQLVGDWDRWVRRMHDSGGYRIYVTGSTSRMTSAEIADALRGRSVSYEIFPFSFREFLRARGLEAEVRDIDVTSHLDERGRILGALEEYLRFGGYPRAVLTEDPEERRRVLLAHYDAIFYRDLVDRCGLDPDLLDAALSSIVSSPAGFFSASKLCNYMRSIGIGCSKAALLKYVECARQSYLVLLSEIYSRSARNRRQYPRKAYVVDNGIVTARYPEVAGRTGVLMENAVAVELARRGIELRYWREYGRREGREVDFVISDGGSIRQLVQVTYAISGSGIRDREIRALEAASAELGCRESLVITWDYWGRGLIGDLEVRYVPLWAWLLGSGEPGTGRAARPDRSISM